MTANDNKNNASHQAKNVSTHCSQLVSMLVKDLPELAAVHGSDHCYVPASIILDTTCPTMGTKTTTCKTLATSHAILKTTAGPAYSTRRTHRFISTMLPNDFSARFVYDKQVLLASSIVTESKD